MTTLLPPNVWIFHLANAFLLLSYLLTDMLFLRLCLAAAGLCFSFWGAFLLVPGYIALDTVIWNAIFVVINVIQAARIIYSRRPIKFREPIHEVIYKKNFESFGVSRLEFLTLLDASTIRVLEEGEIFVNDGERSNNLSILKSGKLSKLKIIDGQEVTVNRSFPFEFVESPEWCLQLNRQFLKPPMRRLQSMKSFRLASMKNLKSLSLKTFPNMKNNKVNVTEITVAENGQKESVNFILMNVTVKAMEDCQLITWSIETLNTLLKADSHLAGAFSSIVAVDVAQKLFNQTGSQFSSNHIINRITMSRERKEEEDYGVHPL